MRTIMVGSCKPDGIYELSDPSGYLESQFEHYVARALACIYPHHRCIVFGGTFEFEGRLFRPDLALVARDFSHWFIIEVELLSHSFEGHVLPQVRAFRYGSPADGCAEVLARETGITVPQAQTLLEFVPKSIVVIVNQYDHKWDIALQAHSIQLVTLSRYCSRTGVEALELSRALEIFAENLGFGLYSAVDRSIIFPKSVRVGPGSVQIDDPEGAPGSWTVTTTGASTWVTKDVGAPDINDGTHVQLVRYLGGRISIRRPR